MVIPILISKVGPRSFMEVEVQAMEDLVILLWVRAVRRAEEQRQSRAL